MADEANPQGMERPNIPTKKVADKNADRQRIATKKGSKGDRPSIPTKKDSMQDRPSIPTKKASDKNADRQRIATKKGSKGDRPSIPTKKEDRPQIPTKGYGNDNEDRPRIPTKKSPYGDRPIIPTKKEDRQERPLIPTKTPPTGPPNFDPPTGPSVSPKGMQKRGGYAQEFPPSKRMLPSIHTKSQAGREAWRNYPLRAGSSDPIPNIAVGEGNDPKGMQRPDTTGY